MSSLIKLFRIIPALAGFAGAAFGQNLVVNGSFENSSTFVPDGSSIMSIQPGSAALTGWTVVNAEIAWGKDTNPYVPGAAHGNYFLDLTGYHDFVPFGGIAQAIATVPGETYTLSFALGTHQGNPVYHGPVQVGVTAGGVSRSFISDPPTGGVSWEKFSLSFVAEASTTAIRFVGEAGGPNRSYIGLDNIWLQLGPELMIERNVTGAVLSWPGSAVNFALEETSDLVNSVWQPVATPPIPLGDRFTVPVLLSEQKRFFRLVRRT